MSNELTFNLQKCSTISYCGIGIGINIVSLIFFGWHEINSAIFFSFKERKALLRKKKIEEKYFIYSHRLIDVLYRNVQCANGNEKSSSRIPCFIYTA